MKTSEEFINHLEQRMVSSHTIRAYRSDLAQFDLWNSSRATNTLARAHVASYLEHLAASGNCRATVARKFTSLRSYCRWLVDENEIAEDPTSTRTTAAG